MDQPLERRHRRISCARGDYEFGMGIHTSILRMKLNNNRYTHIYTHVNIYTLAFADEEGCSRVEKTDSSV